MAEKKRGSIAGKRNEHPMWVDIAKYFIDQFGLEVGTRMLHLIVPEKAKAWLKDTLSGAKGEALLGSIAIGAARIIPDTAFGEVLEEAIRELAASLKNFVGNKSSESPESSIKDMPADVREKTEAVRQAVELGRGLLSVPVENANAIAVWLAWLKKEKGDKAAGKAFLMLNGLPAGSLETFSWFDLESKNAYLDAFSFEEEKTSLPLPTPEKPSWIEKQRTEMENITKIIDNDNVRLKNEKNERRGKLRAAWDRFANNEHQVSDDMIQEEIHLLDEPKKRPATSGKIATPAVKP